MMLWHEANPPEKVEEPKIYDALSPECQTRIAAARREASADSQATIVAYLRDNKWFDAGTAVERLILPPADPKAPPMTEGK